MTPAVAPIHTGRCRLTCRTDGMVTRTHRALLPFFYRESDLVPLQNSMCPQEVSYTVYCRAILTKRSRRMNTFSAAELGNISKLTAI